MARPATVHDGSLWWRSMGETWAAGMDATGALPRLQAARLAQLLRRATADSPFWRRHLGACTPHAPPPLAEIAPVDKVTLMAAFNDWACDRAITHDAVQRWLADPQAIGTAWLGRYLVWTSSGTSGEPGVFVQDAAALAAYDAIDTLRLRAASAASPWTAPLTWWLAGQRIAYVGALGGHFAGVANMRRVARLAAPWPAWWVPQVQELSVLDPLPEIAQALQSCRPSVLVTYPSCAAALARLAAGGALDIAPRETWLGGEQLSPGERRVVEAAFGTTRSGYGASEFISIAWECSAQRLHVNEDWVILEPVDTQGRAVEPGETSHAVLLTNLANTLQPLIRYRLSDRVRWHGRGCACGSRLPVIEVEGRDDDTLLLSDAQRRAVSMLPMALSTVLEDEAGLTRFQLLQLDADALELRLDASEPHPGEAFVRGHAALCRYLARHGLSNVSVRLGQRPLHAATRSGKLRRVQARAQA